METQEPGLVNPGQQSGNLYPKRSVKHVRMNHCMNVFAVFINQLTSNFKSTKLSLHIS